MKTILLSFFIFIGLLSAKDINQNIDNNTTNILFSIDNKKYKISDLPIEYTKVSQKEQKAFVNRYIYYTIFFSHLKKEQKIYKTQITKSIKKAEKELKRKGIVLNKLKKIIYLNRTTLDTIAYNKVLSQTKDIDKKVVEFYNKYKTGYDVPNSVEISQIVLKNKKKANEILKKIDTNSTDIQVFSKLADKYSLDRRMGGYVGYAISKSIGKENFDILWKAKEKSIVKTPLKYKDYYCIVYVLNKKKSTHRSLQEEEENIKHILLKKDINRWVNENYAKIKDKTKVKLYNIKL